MANQTLTAGDLTEDQSAAVLAHMFHAADMPSHWPLESDEVVSLIRDGGKYDVTLEVLEQWARTKSVGSVRVRSGTFQWSPGNVIAALSLANASRLWLLDSKHVSKMTGAELAELQARSIGETIFSDLADVDLRSLIGVISNTNDPENRSVLCLGLIAKLRHDGVIQ